MAYSRDFREKVLKVKKEEGIGFKKVAKRFGISIRTVVKWAKNIDYKKTRNKAAVKIDMEALKKDLEKYPDGYLYERGERLGVSRMGIWYAFKRLGVTYKKNSQASQGRSRKAQYILPKNK